DVGGPEAILDWTRRALAAGGRLFLLRTWSLAEAEFELLARDFGAMVHRVGARWLVDTSVEQAHMLRADGVHLGPERLLQLKTRPLPEHLLVAASCGNVAQLAHAGRIAADFVTLAPVNTADPSGGAGALGWGGFARLVSFSPLPVYAHGGVGPDDLGRAREHGGFGVAGCFEFKGAK